MRRVSQIYFFGSVLLERSFLKESCLVIQRSDIIEVIVLEENKTGPSQTETLIVSTIRHFFVLNWCDSRLLKFCVFKTHIEHRKCCLSSLSPAFFAASLNLFQFELAHSLNTPSMSPLVSANVSKPPNGFFFWERYFVVLSSIIYTHL